MLQETIGLGRSEFNSKRIIERMNALQAESAAKVQEVSAAIKAQVAAGHGKGPDRTVRKLISELRKLQGEGSRQIGLLQKAHGISEGQIRAIERAREAALLPKGNDLWLAQVEQVQPTGSLDDYVQPALRNDSACTR